MNLAYHRDTRRRPFRMGAHVTINGEHATIAGCAGDHIRVQYATGYATILVHVDDVVFPVNSHPTI